jgi:hypothetical protein
MSNQVIIDRTAPALRERVDSALACLDGVDGGEAWRIVDRIFAAVYHVLKQNNHLARIRHDQFDELTANVRERLSEELDELIGGRVAIDDVHRVLDYTLGDELKEGESKW